MNETPMRPEYEIKDKELLTLVKNIFIEVDQGWSDNQAIEIAQLIIDFNKSRYGA